MLNIPLRGEGSIDDKEEAFIAGLTAWMDVNSEGIYATRPWKVFGEGPSTTAPPPRAYGPPGPPYTAEDIRFTQKGDTVYAFVGAWPASRVATIKSLATTSPQLAGAKVTGVSLLGSNTKLTFSQDAAGLSVNLPAQPPSQQAITLKISGVPTA
jgi:alpha-L-fucosidase